MNWQTAKELITVVLSIFGAVGLVITPIVVAIINNRPKPKDKDKPDPVPVSAGMPINIEYQIQTTTLMKYLDDVIESKNDLEKRLFDSEVTNKILKDQMESYMKPKEKEKDKDQSSNT